MRFRFRFGLKTLLLVMTVFAIFFGVFEYHAHRQRALKHAVSLLNGSMRLVPNCDWQPRFLTKFLGEDRTMTVVAVKFVAYQAPNLELDSDSRPYALASPETVRRLIEQPGMRSVRDLEIIGTSTTPEMRTLLSKLQQLERLRLTSSMLTHADLDSLRSSLPDCEVDGSSMAHTVHWIRQRIPESRLPDLSVFSRARDGDPDAISELVELSARERYLKKIIDRVLGIADELDSSLEMEQSNQVSASRRK